jgi:ATP-binding cassette subfamily B protein
MSSAITGTQNEDRSEYTREESKEIRRRSLRLLGSLVSPLKPQIVLAAAVLVVSTALQVAGPILISIGLDRALPAAVKQADWMPTFMIGGIYLLAGALAAVLIAWYVIIAAKLTQAVLLDLRKRIFLHTQRLSLEFHESYTSGRIISRQTSDLDSIKELLDGGLNELVSGVLFGLFTFIALCFWDWQSGLILAIGGVPLFFLMRWFYSRSQLVYRESRVISAKVIVQFVETMTGIRAVKAFRKEPRNDKAFQEIAGEYRDVNRRSMLLFGTFEPGLMGVAALVLGIVVLWGGIRVSEGALTVGVLLSAVLYVRNFFAPMQEIAMFLNSYQSATAALEKVSGVLDEVPTVPDPEKPIDLWESRGHIGFDEVTFGYNGEKTILPNFSLDIPAGQTIALVGTTGAGKSTLAKLISRFYDPPRGGSRSTASTCARCTRRTSAARSSWSRRRPTCSAEPSPTTSPSASRMRRSTRSRRPRERWAPTGSSRRCPTATAPT